MAIPRAALLTPPYFFLSFSTDARGLGFARAEHRPCFLFFLCCAFPGSKTGLERCACLRVCGVAVLVQGLGKNTGNSALCGQYDTRVGVLGEWVLVPPMLKGVDHAAAGTDGRRMFIFGGRSTGKNAPSTGSKDVQIYDTVTQEWTHGPSMPLGRGGTGNAPFVDTKFMVMGACCRALGFRGVLAGLALSLLQRAWGDWGGGSGL